MATLYPNNDTWVRGEISPRLHARASLDLYRAGLATCVSYLTLPHGGLRRRGGTYFVGNATVSTNWSRLISFVFSADQAYCIELSNLKLRVYAYGARVGTVELTTPWTAQELWQIQFYQSADQMWLAHPAHPLQVLTRTDHTTWTLEEYELEDGPYGKPAENGTKLIPGDYGSSIPVMTSNTTPSGTASTSDGSSPYVVFNKNTGTGVYQDGAAAGNYIAYVFGTGPKTVDAYWVQSYASQWPDFGMPSAWEFQGSDDGVTWTTLDSRPSEVGWGLGTKRFYTFKNKTPYAAYRLFWSSVELGDPAAPELAILEIGVNQAGDEMTPFAVYATSLADINDGAGFTAADIGRTIRIQATDTGWRWLRITSILAPHAVNVRLYGHALPDLSPLPNWRFGALHADEHANAVAIFEERLAIAHKFSVFMSSSFQLNRFSPGGADNDGMEFVNAGGGQANDIVWLADGDGYLLIATTGGIRSLSGSGVDEALTPSSFKNRRSRTHGAARIMPVDTGTSFIYVARSRRILAELTMNQYGRFTSEDIGTISEHIPKRGVKELAYQENPDPMLWFTLDNQEELCGYTHQPAQEVRGMHRHKIGGSGVAVESVCVTPGADGKNDDVWVLVRRIVNGVPVRFIEIMQSPIEGTDALLEDAFHVDAGLSYEGVATNTLSGLTHLVGETVDVLAVDKVYKGLVVDGAGVVTLPDDATTTKAHVGLPFTSEAETLELDVGAKDGSLIGRRKRVSKVILSLYQTDISGLEIKSKQRGDWEDVELPAQVGVVDDTVELYTGNVEVPIDDTWEGQGKINIRHTNPTPCTIRAATLVFDAEP